jgi:hypothetical protein
VSRHALLILEDKAIDGVANDEVARYPGIQVADASRGA